MARYNTARMSFDLSPAQRQAVEEMIRRYEQEINRILGLDAHISDREFFHALLKNHAQATGQPWPEDYPPKQ
jgi:hypothetical protein